MQTVRKWFVRSPALVLAVALLACVPAPAAEKTARTRIEESEARTTFRGPTGTFGRPGGAFDESTGFDDTPAADHQDVAYGYASTGRVPFADPPTEQLPAFIGLRSTPTSEEPARPAPLRFGDGSSAPMS